MMKMKAKKLKCRKCGTIHVVVIPMDDYKAWKSGCILIQDAMPYLDPDVREMFLSGWCGTCWDKLFNEMNPPSED